jgi:predicted Fe-Mo cluster-binding NifX family protein
MVEEIIIACATDNEKHFPDKHSGEATFFMIYKIDGIKAEFITRIENTSPEERMHGDPQKAKGVVGLLKKRNVDVIVSKQYGKNLTRIKDKLVPVIIRTDKIEDGIGLCNKNIDRLRNELKKDGEERRHIILG